MSKEKVISLTKYANDLKSRLSSPVPDKHKNRQSSYTNYLKNELDSVNAKLDALKLVASEAKK